MKHWVNFRTNYSTNPRGQSLVELASFGALLLLCLAMLLQYGMQANYQQNLQMQAFRKAMRIAYYKTGPGAGTSVSMTNDKTIPDPRDSWGNADRRPISAAASVTWDTNLQSLYIDDFDEGPKESDLSRSIIEINNDNNPVASGDKLGLRESDIRDGAIDNINSSKGAFTTAKYGERPCSGQIMMVLENASGQRTALMEEYRRVFVYCSDIIVKNKKSKEDDVGKQYAYVKIDGLQQTVAIADVDNDGELETIIAVKGDQACDSDGYCGRISRFKYVDDGAGDINNECSMIYPWEAEKHTKCSEAKQQGLIQDYKLFKVEDNTLVKTETSSTLETKTTLSGRQEFTHTIRLNNGKRDYVTTFLPAKEPPNWSVSK